VGVVSLIQAPDRFSFPSGHSAAALAVALALGTFLPLPAALLLIAVGLLVGVSRSYLGVHYPGDVLAGWLLGMTGVLTALI
jgi:undecaprenyl-diphosphatase